MRSLSPYVELDKWCNNKEVAHIIPTEFALKIVEHPLVWCRKQDFERTGAEIVYNIQKKKIEMFQICPWNEQNQNHTIHMSMNTILSDKKIIICRSTIQKVMQGENTSDFNLDE